MYQIWCYGGRRPPLLIVFSSICLVSTASYTLVFFFVFSEGSKSTNGLWMNVFVKALPILIPNSSAVSPKTIFAFLTLNTPRSAHNKIFGAKFLSFERLVLTSSQPTHYTTDKQNTPRIAQQNQLVYVAKEPLLHCHRATVIMQNSLSCLPIVEVLECKRGCFA